MSVGTKHPSAPSTEFEEVHTDVFQIEAGPSGIARLTSSPTLTVLTGMHAGLIHSISAETTLIGRSHECGFRVDDWALSRRHCRIRVHGADFLLDDLDSRNGTFVGGQRVAAAVRLQHGAQIQMGRGTVIKFSIQDAVEELAGRQLYEAAVRDPLTGLFNRRYLDERMAAEYAFAARHGSPLSVLIADIDHFKKVNDRFGHGAGDEVLRHVSAQLLRSVRIEDVAARIGGEEFAVILRGIGPQNALQCGERLRHAVDRAPAPSKDGPLPITVSIGVATFDTVTPWPGAVALLEAADRGLYRAKEGGRNRCATSGDKS